MGYAYAHVEHKATVDVEPMLFQLDKYPPLIKKAQKLRSLMCSFAFLPIGNL